ncbi:MAG: pyridoxamine 5'-phosphate oxidase [Phycisphaerae bacterium]
MDKPVHAMRKEYRQRGLLEFDADADPQRMFDRWFDDAVRANLPEPNAMSLATVAADGMPSVRIVLLKGYDERGFVFYTNYNSRKGHELVQQPKAAACFWWEGLERQVRVEGEVSQIDPVESDTYFATRPRESQIGTWVSSQSSVIPGRDALEQQLLQTMARFGHRPIPRPPHWGGYRLRASMIEFWQGREHRLHDRLRYTRQVSGAWLRERLSP